MQLNISKILTPILFIWCIKETCSKTFRGFAKSCSENTPECLKDFAQSALISFLGGVPELEIETLDPFAFEKVQLKLPGGLKMEFIEGQSTGFKKCVIESVRNNENKYEVILYCNLTIEGKYRSVGRMLIFAVNGDGEFIITCNNIRIKLNFELSKINANGCEYVANKNFNSKHTFDGQVHYNLTNIFKGNPELSKVVLGFMNDNWRMVAEEFGNPIVEYGISIILNSVKKLLKLAPFDELVSR